MGGTLEVGDSLEIIKIEPALRCVMTTHRQEELPRDPRILRTAAQHHKAKLGAFAWIRPSRPRPPWRPSRSGQLTARERPAINLRSR